MQRKIEKSKYEYAFDSGRMIEKLNIINIQQTTFYNTKRERDSHEGDRLKATYNTWLQWEVDILKTNYKESPTWFRNLLNRSYASIWYQLRNIRLSLGYKK